jgi:hypothetical protein
MRKLLGTIIGCLIVGYFTALPFGGFMLLFVLPFLAVFFFRGLYLSWKDPEKRKLFFAKTVIWGLLVSAVALLHLYYFTASRSAANEAAQALVALNAKNGHFPNELREVGGDVAAHAKTWHVAFINEKGTFSLFYPATFIMFDTYNYNFEASSWVYRPD